MRRLVRGLPEQKRRFLHWIIDNEPRGDDYIVSRRAVAKALQLTEISVKRYFAEFAGLGFFRKETYRQGICQGVRLFLVRSRCQAFRLADPTPDPTDDPTDDPTTGHDPTRAPTRGPATDPTLDPTPSYEERKKENLSVSLSPARIALAWPHLSRAGFGPDQLDQIRTALAELGRSADRIGQSLDHAEWELSRGAMCDKDGRPVADPCAWVFRSLARTGYYRRPKGYVSPEEQAARDAEEEARAVAAARQAAEEARFAAWRDGLTPDELAAALRGFPGGSKEAWLRKHWRTLGREARADSPAKGGA
uniref:Helix-turn-helix domain-containing protein n=1 Tax=Desulfovibrio sp. U5L TaxID=596152 RepID=I2Q7I2_9BACT